MGIVFRVCNFVYCISSTGYFLNADLDLDTWIVPSQIPTDLLRRGLEDSYKPAGTEVLISAVAHNTPPPIQCGAECHNCEHPQLRCSMHCPEAFTSIT